MYSYHFMLGKLVKLGNVNCFSGIVGVGLRVISLWVSCKIVEVEIGEVTSHYHVIIVHIKYVP